MRQSSRCSTGSPTRTPAPTRNAARSSAASFTSTRRRGCSTSTLRTPRACSGRAAARNGSTAASPRRRSATSGATLATGSAHSATSTSPHEKRTSIRRRRSNGWRSDRIATATLPRGSRRARCSPDSSKARTSRRRSCRISNRPSVPVEWVTLDCYGTLIDWEGGIADALLPLVGAGADRRALAEWYIAMEAELEAEAYRRYREVLDQVGGHLLRALDVPVRDDQPSPLSSSL